MVLSSTIEESRETAQEELAALEVRRKRSEELEHGKDTLLGGYAGALPEAMESLAPEEHHRIYRMLRLKVAIYPDARLEVSGILWTNQGLCQDELSSRW